MRTEARLPRRILDEIWRRDRKNNQRDAEKPILRKTASRTDETAPVLNKNGFFHVRLRFTPCVNACKRTHAHARESPTTIIFTITCMTKSIGGTIIRIHEVGDDAVELATLVNHNYILLLVSLLISSFLVLALLLSLVVVAVSLLFVTALARD